MTGYYSLIESVSIVFLKQVSWEPAKKFFTTFLNESARYSPKNVFHFSGVFSVTSLGERLLRAVFYTFSVIFLCMACSSINGFVIRFSTILRDWFLFFICYREAMKSYYSKHIPAEVFLKHRDYFENSLLALLERQKKQIDEKLLAEEVYLHQINRQKGIIEAQKLKIRD